MNSITEIVYGFIADDEEAMECFDRAVEAIEDGMEGEELGLLIQAAFLSIIRHGNELMPLIRRFNDHIDWTAIGRRLTKAATA